MKTILMVAEKPSLAGSISKILSNGSSKSRKGISPACHVHEYEGMFQRERARFKMTSVCGHVMSLDFESQYNNWSSVKPEDLFNAETRKKEANPDHRMTKFLSSEAKGVDALVLWLDCDKEGENICYEVINAAISSMKQPQIEGKTIFRAHFSAITKVDIEKAMANLGVPDKNQSLSVDARQELDLRIGCAFTRFQTGFFQGKYGDLDSSLISFGPCQTPTLGFCVDRHDQIQSFKSEPYWQLQVKLQIPSGSALTLSWSRVRVFDKEIGNLFLSFVQNVTHGTVTDVTKTDKTTQRPQALNTVELLKVASSQLGISPQTTMHLAERIYIQGFISYPRTETTHYPDNFDLKGPVLQLSNSGLGFSQHAQGLLTHGIQSPRKGTDAGDHPPITPMRYPASNELSGDTLRLYDYIARHFLATISADCKFKKTTVKFNVGGESFECEGKVITSPGFQAVLKPSTGMQNDVLPDLKVGQKMPVIAANLVEKKTTPPDYLSESELITLMEKYGIGTDASISVHINNICLRNYVKVTPSRSLVPTTLGIVLVHGYQKIDGDLVLPTMRAALEKQLALIAAGKVDFQSVLRHALGIFRKKFNYFEDNISGMDELFEVSFTKLSETGKPFSKCGKCNRFMKLIVARPTRLHCSHCDQSYSLPQNGTIKNLSGDPKCPLDDFDLLLWSLGPKSKNSPLCPYCYSNPPFEEMTKNSTCNQCTHPTCRHGSVALGMCRCTECDRGTLVLDPQSGPKWKLFCNRCNVVARVFNGAKKVALEGRKCSDCGAQMIHVDYEKGQSPLHNAIQSYEGCPLCDPVLVPFVMIRQQEDTSGRRGGFGSQRGRGRGGRRGRGRGRGSNQSRGGDDDENDSFISQPRDKRTLGDFFKKLQT